MWGACHRGWTRMPICLGVRTCAPFEEGTLHSWMGGLVVHRWVGGEEGKRWATCLAAPNNWGKLFSLGESGTVVPLLTSAASAPCTGAPESSTHTVPQMSKPDIQATPPDQTPSNPIRPDRTWSQRWTSAGQSLGWTSVVLSGPAGTRIPTLVGERDKRHCTGSHCSTGRRTATTTPTIKRIHVHTHGLMRSRHSESTALIVNTTHQANIDRKS